ncbi:hypothetical protein DFQ27_002483, partial [Actinomortierella ambigua]
DAYASRTRLDYILATRGTFPLVSGYLVQDVTAISSDHFLVSAKVNFADPTNPPKIRAAPSLDTRILYETDFRDKVKEAFSHYNTKRKERPNLYLSASAFWDDIKARCLLLAQQYKNNARAGTRQHRQDLWKSLTSANASLDLDPSSLPAMAEKAAAWEELRALELADMDRRATLAKIQWLEEGEVPSPYFSNRLKTKAKRQTIQGLLDDGTVVTAQARMHE